MPPLLPLLPPPPQGALSDVVSERQQLEAQVAELSGELGRARAALEAAQASAEEERERSTAAAQELQGRLEALEAALAAKEEEAQRAAEAREVRLCRVPVSFGVLRSPSSRFTCGRTGRAPVPSPPPSKLSWPQPLARFQI